MSDNNVDVKKENIEDLWHLEDITTLPSQNTYKIQAEDGKKYKLENKNGNWMATRDGSNDTYAVTKNSSGGYTLTENFNGIQQSYTVNSFKVKREGDGTGYHQDPDPRISYDINELTRQAGINKENGQTITDFRIYTNGDSTQPKTLRITYDASGKPQYQIINHNGTTETFNSTAALSELGITVSDTNNRYYPGGDDYAGVYVDGSGNLINVLKKSDGTYEVYGNGNNGKQLSASEAKSLTSGLTRDDRSAIRNGPGSSDQADVYDSAMHHHHVTKKITLSDITELNGQDLSSYGNWTVDDGRYTMNPDGTVKSTGGRLQFILDLAHTNQWSVQDAIAYVDGYDHDGDKKPEAGLVKDGRLTFANDGMTFNPKSGSYNYFNSTYEKWLNALTTDVNEGPKQAEKLRSDVSSLKSNFETVFDKLQGFTGEASEAAKAVLECILGKFAVTMANIENALEPACKYLVELAELLKTIKEENKLLQDLILERDKLKNELNDLKNELAAATNVYNRTPSEIQDGENEDGSPHMVHNPAKDEARAWMERAQKAVDDKQKELDDKIEEITEKMKLLDEKTLEAEKRIQLIENLQTSIQTFSSIVNQVSGYNSAEEVIAHHDEILEKFESYELMPVITNLTDYAVGDIIMFDDSYGTLYKVLGLDLESGRITIVAVDENGNIIGEPIEIWDQREIAPVGGITPKGTGEVPKTPINPPKGTVHEDDPPPDTGTPPPDTGTTPPDTGTTPPDTGTTPPDTGTTPPDTGTTPPSTETYPGNTYVPFPVEDTEIIGPRTGINAVSSTKSSGLTGLGALAGLAAGAAGIGAAALTEKDEEKEENKEEEKKEEHQAE